MTKLKLIILVVGLAGFLSSCVEPEDPTEVQILTGQWEVSNVIANGQVNFPDDVFLEESVLHLNRNASYLFINVDGYASSGSWTATPSTLTLTDGDVEKEYTIIYSDYQKLQVSYDFSNPATGDIQLIYVFNRIAE
jgi:hypothetical protein